MQLRLLGYSFFALNRKPFALLKIIYEDGRELLPTWTTSEITQIPQADETEEHY